MNTRGFLIALFITGCCPPGFAGDTVGAAPDSSFADNETVKGSSLTATVRRTTAQSNLWQKFALDCLRGKDHKRTRALINKYYSVLAESEKNFRYVTARVEVEFQQAKDSLKLTPEESSLAVAANRRLFLETSYYLRGGFLPNALNKDLRNYNCSGFPLPVATTYTAFTKTAEPFKKIIDEAFEIIRRRGGNLEELYRSQKMIRDIPVMVD